MARKPRIRSGSGGTSGSIIDFYGVARLIDTVADANPERLSTLLRVLRTSDEQLEARVVVELALRCRDPLSPLGTLCRDALKTASDLDLLLRTESWRAVRQVCPEARAAALLNLCDRALASDNPHARVRRRQCRAIRPRLEVAAEEEHNAQAGLIEHLATQNRARCPEYWRLLQAFLARPAPVRRSGSTPPRASGALR